MMKDRDRTPERGPRGISTATSTSAIVLLLILPALTLYLMKGRQPSYSEALPAVLVTLLCGVRLVFLAREQHPNLLLAIVYVYSYVNWGLASIVQMATNIYPWRGEYSFGEACLSLLLALIGLAALEGVRLFLERSKWVTAIAVHPPETVYLAKATVVWLAMILAACAVVFRQIGGWDMVTSYRDEVGEQLYAQIGTLATFQIILKGLWGGTLWVGAFCLGFLLYRQGVRYLSILALGAVGIPFSLLFASPISAPRYWLATVVGAYLLIIAFRFVPRITAFVPTMLVVIYSYAFPFLDYFRNAFEQKSIQQSAYYSMSENMLINWQSGDYDALQQMMNAVRFADQHGFQLGYQALGTAFFWVPRSIWDEKPLTTAILVAEFAGNSFTNLSAPMWVEGYVDGGVIGIMIIMGIYAFVVVVCHRLSSNVPQGSLAVYCALVPYSLFLIRGALMATVAYIVPLLMAAVVTYILQSRVRPIPPAMTRQKPSIYQR